MRLTRSIIPNLFTLMNAYMGFSAIIFISEGRLQKAGLFILLAALFDALDGVIARLLKATSELGAELDSLCDAVSFGVAPAFMLYISFFYQYGEYGILLASLPALAGVTRLARFNSMLTSFEDKLYFTGLPIPGGALTILSFVLFFKTAPYYPTAYNDALYIILVLVVSYAMISLIKFDNMPRFSKKYIRNKPIVFSIFIIGTIASILSKGQLLFPFMMFYIAASGIRHFIKWIHTAIGADDEIDESDDKSDFTYLD